MRDEVFSVGKQADFTSPAAEAVIHFRAHAPVRPEILRSLKKNSYPFRPQAERSVIVNALEAHFFNVSSALQRISRQTAARLVQAPVTVSTIFNPHVVGGYRQSTVRTFYHTIAAVATIRRLAQDTFQPRNEFNRSPARHRHTQRNNFLVGLSVDTQDNRFALVLQDDFFFANLDKVAEHR